MPENRARELLIEWKKILYEYEKSGKDINALFQGGSGAQEGLINQGTSNELETLKDKLFISTGED